jgi:hypothetical protein
VCMFICVLYLFMCVIVYVNVYVFNLFVKYV